MLGGCERALRPTDLGQERLRPAYVRLSALLPGVPGSAAIADLGEQQRALGRPTAAVGRVSLPGEAAAGGRGGDSWIDQAARATDAATKRQHQLQQHALDRAIQQRVDRRREQLAAESGRMIAEQQEAERRRAEEAKVAATEASAPRLSDLRLRVWLLERRKEGPLALAESERQAEEAARTELAALESELRQRLADIDTRLQARLEEIETTQRIAMEKSLEQYREQELDRAREIGEAGAQRLEDVSREARGRLEALAAVVQPVSLSMRLPSPAAEPRDDGGERAFGLATQAANRSQQALAELVRWQVAQRVRAAGRARGYSIRFQRPPGADWPDLTEQARRWLRAETVR